jgi:CBS domain-containing protein
MKVTDALRKAPVTAAPDETILDAAVRMDDAAVGAIVVVDGDRPVGIVTDRDLVVRALARRSPLDARLDSVMSTELVTIDGDADLHDAVAMFETRAIRRLPVVTGGRMVGMLTVDDLLVDLVSDVARVVRPITGQVLFGHPEAQVPARHN